MESRLYISSIKKESRSNHTFRPSFSLKLGIQDWLKRQPSWIFAVYAGLTAFFTYSCMYAFRKPFTVGTFNNLNLFGVDYKILLIMAQIIGYTFSKFIGIRFISELKPDCRVTYIFVLMLMAELALLFFYIIPVPYNLVLMFLNGLPLGMIWGIVFSYLEGRKITEMVGAILCASFILASGVAKSAGEWIMLTFNATEFSMPFITGAVFILPMAISTFLLDCIPSPDNKDVTLRTKRSPMDANQRKNFFGYFLPGLIMLITSYTLLTILREIRDNFAVEIWQYLGYKDSPSIFILSEIPVACITLISLALIYFIHSNFKAFKIIMALILAGFFIIILFTFLFSIDLIGGELWMIGMGTGLYLAYIPFNAFLFERLIASFQYVSNAGFLIYLSDSFGYLGSLCVLLFNYNSEHKRSWIMFFEDLSFGFSIAGAFLVLSAIVYFRHKYQIYQNKKNYGYLHAEKSLLTVDSGTLVNQ